MIFNSEQLLAFIQDSDLTGTYAAPGGRDILAADASIAATTGFAALTPRTIQIRDKNAYLVEDRPFIIVLRSLNHTVATTAKVRMADRDSIIRSLSTVLEEGVHHRIYKFDIKTFFETVDTDHLCRAIRRDLRVPRIASDALERFFARMKALGISGIPRGVPLSATVADYVMREFDESISQSEFVYFYARYVDDIVIVTGGRETRSSFVRYVTKMLPPGLKFNASKTFYVDLPMDRKGTGAKKLCHLDFLGYRFSLFETKRGDSLTRPVKISIAPKKIARLKARICRSFLAFLKDGDLDQLHRRLQMLSGNFNVRDVATRLNRNVGLFCNYRRINDDSNLLEVDALLRAILMGTKAGLAARVAAKISKAQRRRLLVYRFQHSFREKTFYNFKPAELLSLRRCWEHV